MHYMKEIVQLLLIVIVIGLPPYLIGLKTFKDLKTMYRILLSIIYWGGTIYTQQVFPFILIVILLIIHYKNKKQVGIQEESVGKESFTFKDFIIVAGATIVMRFPIAIINSLYVLLIDSIGISIEGQPVIDYFVHSQNNILNILIVFLVVIVAPLNEEFSMRHWLFGKTLSPLWGKKIAAVISSGIFTLLHYNIAGAPTFFLLGLYACYVYDKKGLWGAVSVHFVFNLSSMLLLLGVKSLLI